MLPLITTYRCQLFLLNADNCCDFCSLWYTNVWETQRTPMPGYVGAILEQKKIVCVYQYMLLSVPTHTQCKTKISYNRNSHSQPQGSSFPPSTAYGLSSCSRLLQQATYWNWPSEYTTLDSSIFDIFR